MKTIRGNRQSRDCFHGLCTVLRAGLTTKWLSESRVPVRDTARLRPVVGSDMPWSFHVRALLPWALRKDNNVSLSLISCSWLYLSCSSRRTKRESITGWHTKSIVHWPGGGVHCHPHYASCVGENMKPPLWWCLVDTPPLGREWRAR